ncbi:ArnT family glycosyltransferase [Paracoccus aminovorans]|uniref:ArnT family glycosyltransferase n=1 Tax=Paracoccus aminovorans TaxID=34004 RepID=UPI002B260791|nr:glycosyltransferase family 39 protein [Paracoccus aminovorans]
MIRRHPVALAVGCLLLTATLGLLLRPLAPIDETRYLAVAWEMHTTGNWLVPSKNFAFYSDKPPLLFWAINLVWLVTGVSALAARLVGPACACLAIWLTARLAQRLWPEDPEAGGRAALALAGLAVFALSGSLTMFDAPLAVCVLLGLIALDAARPEDRTSWTRFGAAIALGVLTKGPVILFHLLPAALLFPLWSRNEIRWRQLPGRLGFAVVVALVLVALWLVPAAIAGGPAWREAVLWHQSAGRLAESFAHARPWWWYLALLPVLGFPLLWSPALWHEGRQISWRQDRGLRLCLIWAGAALALFSLTSGKQLHYLVPELPALALVAARLGRNVPGFGLQPAIIAIGLAALAAVGAGFAPLPLRLRMLFDPASAFLAWALLAVALCWAATRWRGAAGAMILSLGLLLATNLLIGTTRTAQVYDAAAIAARMATHRADGLAFAGAPYHAEFNFAARLTKPVAELPDPAALRSWAALHPQGLIVGRIDQSTPPWQPHETILFRNQDYGIWSVADAPQTERNPG